jgi:hypothetical protein
MWRSGFRGYLRMIFLSIFFLSFSGCAHYSIGAGKFLPFQCIHVDPVENRSLTPEIQGFLWQQVVKCLENSPSINVCDRRRADAILEITIDDVTQSVLSTANHDSAIAASYTVTITATYSLRKNLEDKEYFLKDRHIKASIAIPTRISFVEAKRQTLPRLAADLAAKLVNSLIYCR